MVLINLFMKHSLGESITNIQYCHSHTSGCFIIAFYLATGFGREWGPSSKQYTRTRKCTETLFTIRLEISKSLVRRLKNVFYAHHSVHRESILKNVRQCVSMSVCQYVSISVCQYISMSVCQYISMSVCPVYHMWVLSAA
jgi:hypothetical protein